MLVFSIGKRYRGKTTAAYSFMRRLPVRIIYDPRHDFTLKGAHVVSADALKDDDLADVFWRGGDLVVRPRHDMTNELQRLCLRLQPFAERRHQFGVLLDEVRLYKKTLGDTGTAFDDLIRNKSRNLVIVLTAHRIIDIESDVRAIGDLWCVFQTTHQADLKIFNDQFGDPALTEKIKTLKGREFLSWDDGEGIARFHLNAAEWAVDGLQTQSLDIGEPLQVLPSADRPKRHDLLAALEDDPVEVDL